MSVLERILEGSGFAVTAEMAPPKGYDFSEKLKTAEALKGVIHGINVTDMQSSSLKASSLGFCIKLKQSGIEPVVQIAGRGRNRMAIMGEMLSAAGFGIDTMLAITGDHTAVGDCKCAKPVFDLDSVGILRMLSKMEETGRDCGGNPLTSTPRFYKGAVVTPAYDPIYLQISKLRKKVDAGARFVQTQGIFTADALETFMDQVAKANIKVHVIAGIIPLKSAAMARFMNDNVPGIVVPQEKIDRLSAVAEEGKAKGIKGLQAQEGIEMAAKLCREIRDRRLCDGLHLMTIDAEEKIPSILEKAGISI